MAEAILSDDELDLTVEGESDPSPGGEETEAGQPADDETLESPPTGRRDAEDDDADWSEKVKKRIGKEVYRRKAAEEREGQLSADIAALRAEIDQIKSHNADAAARATDGELQGKLASARQRLKQAIEDADTDAQLAAQEALADAKIELREAAARQKRADGDDRQGGGRPQTAPATPATAAPATADWLEQNKWYLSRHDTPQKRRLALLAAALDEDLIQEGYSPDDAGMYQELNRRLRAAMPNAADLIKDVGETAPARGRSAGPPTGSSSADGQQRPGGKRRLTQSDLVQMETFGLDPNSQEDRKAWLATH